MQYCHRYFGKFRNDIQIFFHQTDPENGGDMFLLNVGRLCLNGLRNVVSQNIAFLDPIAH
jgi:hypothetical protein